VEKDIGGCKLNNPYGEGRWFEHESLPAGKIWDCSECVYPHQGKNVRKYLMKLFKGQLIDKEVL